MYKMHGKMEQHRELRGWKELQKTRLESQGEMSLGAYQATEFGFYCMGRHRETTE